MTTNVSKPFDAFDKKVFAKLSKIISISDRIAIAKSTEEVFRLSAYADKIAATLLLSLQSPATRFRHTLTVVHSKNN